MKESLERVDIVSLFPKGEGKRITSKEIKRLTSKSDAVVRRIVNESRANFVPIASDKKGYFMAEKPEELDHTIAQINSRIHMMIRAREGLKKAQKLMKENNNHV